MHLNLKDKRLFKSPYVTDTASVTSIMFKVLLALLPGIVANVWVYGGGILVTLTLATIAAVAAEAALLKIRHRLLKPYLFDMSAVVTAWLLALSLPPIVPWWVIVVGIFFAIVIAKQLYGGIGYNPFNPAMVGYAVLLITFPLIMTRWPAPLSLAQVPLNFTDQLHYIFSQILPSDVKVDSITWASPLDHLKSQLMQKNEVTGIMKASVFSASRVYGSELITGGYLLGGLYLLQQRIISWHLPTAFLTTISIISLVFYIGNPAQFANPTFDLMNGTFMLCAFFIITDPVSGPTTPHGKLYFAAGAGILTYLIRAYGGYPNSIAFAVLIMNMCVPLIDSMTQPRVFGHKSR